LNRRLTTLVLAGFAVLAVGAGSAFAASGPTQTSSNWAGYAVTDSGTAAATGAVPTTFSNVSGSWTQPAAGCTAGGQAYSAFWVGLGGFANGSKALEQIGTESDCSASGRASYSVWYELVPAAPVTVKLKLSPGDSLSATVSVTGETVSLRIADLTRGTVFTRNLTMAAPDLSSAEWVAEAPSTCSGYGGCRPLPLADFGTATFTAASATGNGHTGTISDPAWTETAVDLQGTTGGLFRGRFASTLPTADATPGPLSTDGSSFSVVWAQDTSAPAASPSPYGGGRWGR
jgi:Peptidase A4 family